MANTPQSPSPRAGPVTRPHWTAGSYLTAAACAAEQNYCLQRFRRHNRRTHGYGVVCGLWVVPRADAAHPWSVNICPGYAIGPYGDEIELRSAVPLDVTSFLWSRPAQHSSGVPAYVVLRYQDIPADPVVVPPEPCRCEEPEYRDARTGDGYQAGILWSPPANAVDPGICQPNSPPCHPCPDSPWLTLARIRLPAPGVAITAAMIDNTIRATLMEGN